jgi:hypothetical protein
MTRTRSTVSLRARALQDKPELPRIIVRRPRRGDTQAVPTQVLRGALRSFPPEYLVGLKSIELVPRPSIIGEPFAIYRRSDKTIFLYSLPMSWSWKSATAYIQETMKHYGAEISSSDTCVSVQWESAVARSVWFVMEVLSHEIGHHYRYQNRFRRKQSPHSRDEEMGAYLHSWRIKASIRENRKKRSNQAL